MGCAPSQPISVTSVAKNEVDEQLEMMQEEERWHYKLDENVDRQSIFGWLLRVLARQILLLGPGEAGKSTVLKQLKCLYKGGIPLAEQRMHGVAIRRNTIQSMQAIVEATVTLHIELDDVAADAGMRVLNLDETADLTPSVVQDIMYLWQHPAIRMAYAQRHRYWLLDAAAYYFDNVARFASDSFAPNEEDVILARARTSGIMVTRITEGQHKFSVVDVGGQRSERRKWIHCFDDVKAIIFVVALSGYNQVLFEDASVNRMHEGLALFEEVVQNPIFQQTPIFVFLNKKDLFEQMMLHEGVPLTRCFPDYRPITGNASDVHLAIEEIERRFRGVMQRHSPRKHLHMHVMAARVRLEMKSAFADVKERLKDFYAREHAHGSFATHDSRF